MNTRCNDPIRERRFRRLLAAFGLAAAVVLIGASPALADSDRGRGRGHERYDRGRHDDHDRCCRGRDRDARHDRGYHRGHDRSRHRVKVAHDHRRHRYGHDVVRYEPRRAFVVPQHIHRHDRADFGRFYQRRIYHRGHRHEHAVYRFPVYTPYGVFYRHYPYCGGVLYRDGISGFVTIGGRNLRIGIGF